MVFGLILLFIHLCMLLLHLNHILHLLLRIVDYIFLDFLLMQLQILYCVLSFYGLWIEYYYCININSNIAFSEVFHIMATYFWAIFVNTIACESTTIKNNNLVVFLNMQLFDLLFVKHISWHPFEEFLKSRIIKSPFNIQIFLKSIRKTNEFNYLAVS